MEANISISDLDITGYDLFFEPESFMREIADQELQIKGGIINPDDISVASIHLPDILSIIY